MDIPSIDVIRHWIAWDNDEQDLLRVKQFEAWLALELEKAKATEQKRIIRLLIDLDAIRRDALGELVAFNTHGTEVIYLNGLEAS